MDVLHRIPTIAVGVISVLASYEQQSRQEAAQGKISAAKKSGHYNTVDIVTVPPHLCWPMKVFMVLMAGRDQHMRNSHFPNGYRVS